MMNELGLSVKQYGVYELLVQPVTYEFIKSKLGITKHGLNYHINNLLHLMDFKSRSELVAEHYLEHGEVALDISSLPEYQQEVFMLIIKGYTTTESAEILNCNLGRIHTVRQHIFRDTGTNNNLDVLFKYYGVHTYDDA